MKLKLLPSIALLLAASTALADTMTLKIPLKVVLMRDEVSSVRVSCRVTAMPFSSGAAAATAIANGSAPTSVYVSSEAYPLDSFGNLDTLVPLEVNLDQIRNLDKHYLQSSPVYFCHPEFLNTAGDVVLSDTAPHESSERGKLYDLENSVFTAQASDFVPDAPSRFETLLGGRSGSGEGQLKRPTQSLKLQR